MSKATAKDFAEIGGLAISLQLAIETMLAAHSGGFATKMAALQLASAHVVHELAEHRTNAQLIKVVTDQLSEVLHALVKQEGNCDGA
jgi:hypothetical protein